MATENQLQKAPLMQRGYNCSKEKAAALQGKAEGEERERARGQTARSLKETNRLT